MSAHDEGHEYGTELRAQNSGLDAHPNSINYRTTHATVVFQGGLRAGQLGYSDDEAGEFALGFFAGIYGK